MAQKKLLYKLNAEEKRIFELARTDDVSYFTDYYLRGPNSGTWWLPGAKTDRWRLGYARLEQVWRHLNCPNYFDAFGHQYRVVLDHDKSREFPDQPAFHHNHGILFLDWQKDVHNDRTPVQVIVGGTGSSKTWGMCISDLVYAATLPGYRGLVLGPYMDQAAEAYKQMTLMMEGTLYQARFLENAVSSPTPKIVVANDLVGENVIDFRPIGDDPRKLLTLTADRGWIDQAELLADIPEVIRIVGSRFRGRTRGRARIGTVTLVANSADNQQLWDTYDMAEVEPENYAARTVSSYDNVYLTDDDLYRMELQNKNDQEAIRIHLLGGRPLGNGKEFSREVVERNRSVELTEVMRDGRNQGLEGYIKLEAPQVGIYEWLLPPRVDRIYLQISDPGTANPPYRNSPPIMVWDITEFPREPASLQAFVWVYGNGDIRNWATRFAELAIRYNTVGRCGYDATGPQASYDTWMYILDELLVEPISLSGQNKFYFLNSAKMLFSKGLFRIPSELAHIFSQLTRYDILEDKTSSKMRQDLVMVIIMTAWWLQRLYYSSLVDDFTPRPGFDGNDRHFRTLEGRDSGHIR